MFPAYIEKLSAFIDVITPLVEILLSCLLGFVLAYLVEILWDKKKSTKQAIQLKKALSEELTDIKGILSGISDEKLFISPYSIPIWTGANKSGLILCVDNIEEFNKIVGFYALLEEANLVETTAFEVLNINPQANKKAIYDNVLACRNELRNKIDDVLDTIKGE